MDFSSEYIENSCLITQPKLVLQWTNIFYKHFWAVGWFSVIFTFLLFYLFLVLFYLYEILALNKLESILLHDLSLEFEQSSFSMSQSLCP